MLINAAAGESSQHTHCTQQALRVINKTQFPVRVISGGEGGGNVLLSLIKLPSLIFYTVLISLQDWTLCSNSSSDRKSKYQQAQTNLTFGSFWTRSSKPDSQETRPIKTSCWQMSRNTPPKNASFYQMLSSRAAGALRLCQIKPASCSSTNADKTAGSSLFLPTFPSRCSAY